MKSKACFLKSSEHSERIGKPMMEKILSKIGSALVKVTSKRGSINKISANTHPTDHMSQAKRSVVASKSNSGAMYPGVPLAM